MCIMKTAYAYIHVDKLSFVIICSCRCFDIYHDSMVHEAKRVLPVLTSLVKRVEEVLVEWPDYPVLVQVFIFVISSSLT